MLRKAAQLPVEKLWQPMGELLSTFKPTECFNYFAGYATIQTDRNLFN
jgi:hypothetical protein